MMANNGATGRLKAAMPLLLGASLLAVGCAARAATPAVATGQAEATAQAEFLRKAVAGTPYSALVVHTRVDIAPVAGKGKGKGKPKPQPDEPGEERQTYYARVLETFRGSAQPAIRYEMVVESGEAIELDSKPQIVTLCKGTRGFYWPGVGASFPGTDEAIADARRLGKQPASGKAGAASQCD